MSGYRLNSVQRERVDVQKRILALDPSRELIDTFSPSAMLGRPIHYVLEQLLIYVYGQTIINFIRNLSLALIVQKRVIRV